MEICNSPRLYTPERKLLTRHTGRLYANHIGYRDDQRGTLVGEMLMEYRLPSPRSKEWPGS